jgi:hypothetical protein
MTESVSAGPFTYTIAPQVVAAPTASPSGATGYDGASGIDVTLGTTTSGATIRYTTNDTYTTASSPVYASPIKLGQASSNVIYAQAFRDGMLPSPIAGPFRYTRGPQIAQVTLTTTDRTNPAGPLVTPSCPTPGVAMEYTFLDRATQTWSPRPMPYTGAAIRVPPGKMLYVRAYAQGMSSFWASIGF